MLKLREYIHTKRDQLARAELQCEDPLLHAKQIAELALGWDTARLYTRWEDEVTANQTARIDALVERRCTGEPFQYIAGFEWFWDCKFKVGPGVFIPRRETECLVEEVLKREDRPEVTVAELGVGSANIGVSLLRERPGWKWHGYEGCETAWPYIEHNLANLEPGANFHLHKRDFFEGVHEVGPVDWWISNPPYVQREFMDDLPKEVKREPVMALEGGPGGLVLVRRWLELGRTQLVSGGRTIFEFSPEQNEPAREILVELGYTQIEEYKDYAGWVRGLTAVSP